jgi:hypothetical protein
MGRSSRAAVGSPKWRTTMEGFVQPRLSETEPPRHVAGHLRALSRAFLGQSVLTRPRPVGSRGARDTIRNRLPAKLAPAGVAAMPAPAGPDFVPRRLELFDVGRFPVNGGRSGCPGSCGGAGPQAAGHERSSATGAPNGNDDGPVALQGHRLASVAFGGRPVADECAVNGR